MVLLASVAVAAPQPISPSDPPDDTSAILLSSVVGFGAGHYYAGQPQAGDPHAALQAVSLVGVGMGAFLLASAPSAGNARASDAQQGLGTLVLLPTLTVFLVDRAVDVITAPRSVRRTLAAQR